MCCELTMQAITLEPVPLEKLLAQTVPPTATTMARCRARSILSVRVGCFVGHASILIAVLSKLRGNAAKFIAPGMPPMVVVGSHHRDCRGLLSI
jgi:hypothetical protein